MTFNVGSVQGGTHAGWKRQKPKPTAWECKCREFDPLWHREGHKLGRHVVQPAYMSRCPDCKTKRGG